MFTSEQLDLRVMTVSYRPKTAIQNILYIE